MSAESVASAPAPLRAASQGRWLAEDPAKRRLERFVLAYSPAWIGIIGLVQVSGWLATWGDAAHLAIGIGLALPLWIYALALPGEADRARPFHARYGVVFTVWIGISTFLQMYFGSALFFDVLGMEYHFNTTIELERSPLFLYFLTVPYFSTYYVVMSVLWRGFTTRAPRAPVVLKLVVLAVLCYAVAFAETAGMATPPMRRFFLYRDLGFMLTYGSAAYASVFITSLPLFFVLHEDATRPRTRALEAALSACAAAMLGLLAYEGWRAVLTPAP